MEHSFDIDIAKEYGIEEAILLNHFQFWIAKNKANNQNFNDGYYWTFNSMKALAELFPYMNNRKIDYAIENLIKNGLIIKGNYNKKGFDRTLWYAITQKGYAILQKCEMENTKLLNANDKIVEPIPNIKTQLLDTNNKENTKEKIASYNFSKQINEIIDEWLTYKKEKKQNYKDTGFTRMLNSIDKGIKDFGEQAVIKAIEQAMSSNYAGFFIKGTYQKPAEKQQFMQHEYTKQDFDNIYDDIDKVVLK